MFWLNHNNCFKCYGNQQNVRSYIITDIYNIQRIPLTKPCQVGLVVSVSASHTAGRGFASWPGITKDHHKNGTNCLSALQARVRVGV